jgi:cytochrome c peroxidase
MRPGPIRPVLVALALALAAACGDGSNPSSPLDTELRAALRTNGITPLAPLPAANSAQVALGRALMFDKVLSGNKDIACATCHHPLTHTSDGLFLSVGTGGTGSIGGRSPGPGKPFIPRNAPDLYNRGYAPFTRMFDDGRVELVAGALATPAGAALPAGLTGPLAAQAMFPVLDRDEMRGQPGDLDVNGQANELAAVADGDFAAGWTALQARLMAIPGYVTLFQAAFPGVPANQLGFQHAANAIGAFEAAAFNTVNSPFDGYLHGDDAALSDSAKRGALVFYGRGRCVKCHAGNLLSNQNFQNIASPQLGPGKVAGGLDPGRGVVTGVAQEQFLFRAPPLRNVALTGPYMHNGAYVTLEAAVRHYSNPRVALATYDASQLSPVLQPTVHSSPADLSAVLATIDTRVDTTLDLSAAEVAQLVAFLESLTDPAAVDQTALVPASVPSGLPVD